MDFDRLSGYVCDKYKVMGRDISRNFFLESAKTVRSKTIEFVLKKTKKPTFSRSKIEKGVKEFISNLNYNRGENDPEINYKLTKFTRAQIKERKKIQEGAAKALAQALAITNTNAQIVASFNLGLGNEREIEQFLKSGAKNDEELYDICQAFANRNDPQNKQKVKEFFTDCVKQCKDMVDKMAICPNDQELVNFMANPDNIRALAMAAELQAGNLAKMNNKLDLGIDPKFIREWDEVYSNRAVDLLGLRTKVFAMANPLYPELSESDINFINEIAIQDNLNSPQWLKDYCTIEDVVTGPSGNTYNLSQFDGYAKSTSLNAYKKIDDVYGYTTAHVFQTEKLRENIKFIENILAKGNSKSFILKDDTGAELSIDQAADKIYNGDNVNLLDSDGNFLMGLEADPNENPGFIKENETTRLLKTELVGESRTKNDKLFKEVERLQEAVNMPINASRKKKLQKELDKNKKKIAKEFDKVQKNVHKQFNSTAKDLFKETKKIFKNEPRNEKLNVFLGLLEELKDDKSRYLHSKSEIMKDITSECQKYLSDKLQNGQPLTKADKQVAKLFASFKDIDSKLNEYSKSLEAFDIKEKEPVRQQAPQRQHIVVNLENEIAPQQQVQQNVNVQERVQEINNEEPVNEQNL